MSDANIKTLEAKIDELIAFCRHLEKENRSLKEKENQLLIERAELVEKNHAVKQRVETIVERLKTLQENRPA